MKVASSRQINGTPSFLVGKAIGGEVFGVFIVGAQPLFSFGRLSDWCKRDATPKVSWNLTCTTAYGGYPNETDIERDQS